MSLLDAAFVFALNGAEAVKGNREKVTFREVEMDALVRDLLDDVSPTVGGYSEMTPVTVSLRLEDFNQLSDPSPIAYLEQITVRGKDLSCITPSYLEARIDIVCGDVTEEQQG